MSKRKPLNRGKQNENRRSPARSPAGSPAKSSQGESGKASRGNSARKSDTRPGNPAKGSRASGGGSGKSSWKPQTTGSAPKRRSERNERSTTSPALTRPTFNSANNDWLYGAHPVHEALKNPKRTLHRLIATSKAAEALPTDAKDRVRPELATSDEVSTMLPEGAVHQGLALHTAPLPELGLEDILSPFEESDAAPLLILDQVSDPHNVGAIIRSAAAFGAAAVIVQDRHAPQITGTLAKSASGAVEHIPVIRVTNLARALEAVADAGYFRIGLAGEADQELGKVTLGGKTAIVLGAEGPGLRRLTREKCDLLVKLPTHEPISSLNVSNAAAVALFAVQT